MRFALFINSIPFDTINDCGPSPTLVTSFCFNVISPVDTIFAFADVITCAATFDILFIMLNVAILNVSSDTNITEEPLSLPNILSSITVSAFISIVFDDIILFVAIFFLIVNFSFVSIFATSNNSC